MKLLTMEGRPTETGPNQSTCSELVPFGTTNVTTVACGHDELSDHAAEGISVAINMPRSTKRGNRFFPVALASSIVYLAWVRPCRYCARHSLAELLCFSSTSSCYA